MFPSYLQNYFILFFENREGAPSLAVAAQLCQSCFGIHGKHIVDMERVYIRC
jgi:hypothetical protein